MIDTGRLKEAASGAKAVATLVTLLVAAVLWLSGAAEKIGRALAAPVELEHTHVKMDSTHAAMRDTIEILRARLESEDERRYREFVTFVMASNLRHCERENTPPSECDVYSLGTFGRIVPEHREHSGDE